MPNRALASSTLTFSLPFKVENAPEKTVSLAIVLEDKDAYPVTGGFTWIHWLAANIARFEIKDNESQTATDFVQGRNSWTSIQGGEPLGMDNRKRSICRTDFT